MFVKIFYDLEKDEIKFRSFFKLSSAATLVKIGKTRRPWPSKAFEYQNYIENISKFLLFNRYTQTAILFSPKNQYVEVTLALKFYFYKKIGSTMS